MAKSKQKEEKKINHTTIEWCKNPDGTQGYTWNPITGCLNGCEYCYARRLANTRLKERILNHKSGYGISTQVKGKVYQYGGIYHPMMEPRDPFWPHYWPERLEEFPSLSAIGNKEYKSRLMKRGKGVFLCSLGELFGDWIPHNWVSEIMWRIRCNPQHRFYLLTKQPQNLIKFSPFPDNCYVGVSATKDDELSSALLYLNNIDATKQFISFEPLLEPMKDLAFVLKYRNLVDWVIIGAQTKPTVMPKIEWVQEIVDAADKAGVKVFLKDNLYPLFNVITQNDAFSLKQDYPWAFLEQKSKFEDEHIAASGRVISLRQEMP